MSIVERETTVPAVTRKDVLHRAADLLTEFGWCQGTYGSKVEGAFCAEGAIFQAVLDLYGRGYILNATQWRRVFASLGDHLPNWNDAPGRTRAEVVARLREAANA